MVDQYEAKKRGLRWRERRVEFRKSVKNEEKVSGSDVLDTVDGNTVGGFRCKRLFIVCQSLRGCRGVYPPQRP